MKKKSLTITKYLSLLLLLISGYLLIFTPSSLKVNDTHDMFNTIINKQVAKSDNSELQTGLNFLESTGLTDNLFKQIPKKYQWNFSYYNLYQLSNKYNQDGKVEPSDFNLASSNQMVNLVNNYIFKQINQKLDQDKTKIKEGLTIYRAFFWLVILLYLLAAILLLFNRYFASILLLFASIGSYFTLWSVINRINQDLKDIYSGLSIQIGSNITLGLILTIISSVLWWICLKQIRKEKFIEE